MLKTLLSIKLNDTFLQSHHICESRTMSLPFMHPRSVNRSDGPFSLSALSLPAMLRRLSAMRAAYRQRVALAALDAKALHDIGITRDMAEAEASRPVWDVPPSWRL